jgi:hypothetical protein
VNKAKIATIGIIIICVSLAIVVSFFAINAINQRAKFEAIPEPTQTPSPSPIPSESPLYATPIKEPKEVNITEVFRDYRYNGTYNVTPQDYSQPISVKNIGNATVENNIIAFHTYMWINKVPVYNLQVHVKSVPLITFYLYKNGELLTEIKGEGTVSISSFPNYSLHIGNPSNQTATFELNITGRSWEIADIEYIPYQNGET